MGLMGSGGGGLIGGTRKVVTLIERPPKPAEEGPNVKSNFEHRSAMTIDEAIERLGQIREEYGGDMPFCIEKESMQSGKVNLFEPLRIEVYNVVEVPLGEKTHWVCLMAGNNTQVAVAW